MTRPDPPSHLGLKHSLTLILYMALGLSLATRGHSAESAMFEENFPEARDISDSKDNSGSWVPVPIPISNPTLGTGLQAVLLYLHPTEDDQDNLNRTSGIGVMRTVRTWLCTSRICALRVSSAERTSE